MPHPITAVTVIRYTTLDWRRLLDTRSSAGTITTERVMRKPALAAEVWRTPLPARIHVGVYVPTARMVISSPPGRPSRYSPAWRCIPVAVGSARPVRHRPASPAGARAAGRGNVRRVFAAAQDRGPARHPPPAGVPGDQDGPAPGRHLAPIRCAVPSRRISCPGDGERASRAGLLRSRRTAGRRHRRGLARCSPCRSAGGPLPPSLSGSVCSGRPGTRCPAAPVPRVRPAGRWR